MNAHSNNAGEGESAGGRCLLICLAEAKGLLLRLSRAATEIVDIRTHDGRAAFVACVAAADARAFLTHPRSGGLVLRGEAAPSQA